MKLKNALICALKVALFVLIAASCYFWFPVPTARHPNAKLWLNTWANGISARVASWGAELSGEGAATTVDQATCVITKGKLPEAYKTAQTLTFAFDNIVALSIPIWIVAASYLLLLCGKPQIGRALLGMLCCVVIFIALFLVRDFIFGIVAAKGHIQVLSDVDNPVRALLVAVSSMTMLIVSHVGEAKKI